MDNNNENNNEQTLTPEEIKMKKKANFSLIVAIIPILIFFYCLIVSGGSTSEGDAGLVWIFFFGYYIPIGGFLSFVSLANSIELLNTKWANQSLLTIFLLFVPVLLIIIGIKLGM